MTEQNLSLNQTTLKQRLTEIPPDVRPHLKNGFHLISRSDDESRAEFLRFVLKHFTDRSSFKSKEAADIIGLDENTIPDAISATTLSIGATVDLDICEDDFIEFGRDSIFSESDEDTVRQLIKLILSSKSELNSSLRIGSLSNIILPSYRNISSAIELRLDFSEDDEFEVFTPIAIFLITTDCDDDISFQASLSAVKNMREKLERVERQLEAATKLKVSKDDAN